MRELICVRHQLNVPLAAMRPAVDGAQIPWRYVDAWTDPEWPDARDIGGLIVLGGKMSALQDDEYPFLKQVRQLMVDAIERDVPVLGSCLGSQLLSQVLGGEVYRMERAEAGFVEVTPTAGGRRDPVVGPIGDLERVLVWHEDSYTLPEGAQLLASSDLAEHQAFRVGRAYGIQFHVEATEAEITEWADETDPDELREWWGIDKAQMLTEANTYLSAQRAAAARVAGAFVELTD